jgi:hypothetical protein
MFGRGDFSAERVVDAVETSTANEERTTIVEVFTIKGLSR